MMVDYTLIERAEDLGPLAERIARAGVIGIDIETYDPIRGGGSFDPITGEIRLVQLNVNDEPDGIFVIDLMRTGTLGPVETAFGDTKAVFIAHNAKFEQKWFKYKYNMKLWPLFCTFRASALLNNGRDVGNGLWDLYERELGIHEHPPDLAASDWSNPNLTKDQLAYAVDDVVHLPKLRTILKKKLAESGLLLTALIEFGAILPEGEIELNGFGFDKESWLVLAQENKQRAFDMAEELFQQIPHPSGQIALPGMNAGWNLGSPQQMLKALRGMKIDVEDTKEATLSMVAGKHPIVKDILAHRKTAKQITSFGPDYLKHLHPVTGRIHTSFYAMLAAGRYSSSKPNLQQIPRDPRFRKCFTAAPGKTLVAADYAGIEMRIVAEISNDAELIRVFLDNEDAHKATAAIVKGKALDKITKAERQLAKPVNFGLIYGMEAKSLVLYSMSGYGVAMTVREAQNYIDRFFGRYSGIKRWHDRVTRDGRRSGCSRTLSGRLRWLDPQKAWNEWKNTPVQGTGADALKTSMGGISERLAKYEDSMRMVHIVHDEVILEVDDDPDCIQMAESILHDEMKVGMEKFLKVVPVVVDPAHGRTWADVH
jgi:DNA polymerase-1